MSVSSYELASQSLAKQLISIDTELTAKMFGKDMHVEEIYQIFRQRLSLYDSPSYAFDLDRSNVVRYKKSRDRYGIKVV